MIFSKRLIKLAIAYGFPYRSPKLGLDLQSQNSIFSLISITILLNFQIDKVVYHSDLETSILAYFPSKDLSYKAINLFLQKFSTLTIVKFTISTKTDITLQTSVKNSRAITMCSAFTPYCGNEIALLFSLGTCIVQIQSVWVNFACTKRLFNQDYQCPQCGSVCQVRNNPFEEQPNSFFLSPGQGVYNFEESLKSVQDFIGDVYCPGKYCSNREKCASLGGYVTTPRSIYAWGKCGAWLFAHKVPFMLQEHVKTTETDKTRFFFAKKRWTWYPTNNYYLMSHFRQPNIERKNCVWTAKY